MVAQEFEPGSLGWLSTSFVFLWLLVTEHLRLPSSLKQRRFCSQLLQEIGNLLKNSVYSACLCLRFLCSKNLSDNTLQFANQEEGGQIKGNSIASN